MKKILQGIVISNKMTKTVVVRVERKIRHPLYQKIIIKHKKYKAHNEEIMLEIGDIVEIEETKPISKDKRFKLMEVLPAGRQGIK